jgi:hypothetical protein
MEINHGLSTQPNDSKEVTLSILLTSNAERINPSVR